MYSARAQYINDHNLQCSCTVTASLQSCSYMYMKNVRLVLSECVNPLTCTNWMSACSKLNSLFAVVRCDIHTCVHSSLTAEGTMYMYLILPPVQKQLNSLFAVV